MSTEPGHYSILNNPSSLSTLKPSHIDREDINVLFFALHTIHVHNISPSQLQLLTSPKFPNTLNESIRNLAWIGRHSPQIITPDISVWVCLYIIHSEPMPFLSSHEGMFGTADNRLHMTQCYGQTKPSTALLLLGWKLRKRSISAFSHKYALAPVYCAPSELTPCNLLLYLWFPFPILLIKSWLLCIPLFSNHIWTCHCFNLINCTQTFKKPLLPPGYYYFISYVKLQVSFYFIFFGLRSVAPVKIQLIFRKYCELRPERISQPISLFLCCGYLSRAKKK